jgi:epoxyqueuosine reductase
VAHESGLAGAEIAPQFDERIGDRRLGGQPLGKNEGVLLVVPVQQQRAAYNRRVTYGVVQVDGPSRVARIRAWAHELGFSQIGVAGIELSSAEPGLLAWLSQGFHGEMSYMASHGLRRARPAELVPGTVSVLTARMDYLPRSTPTGWQAIEFERLARPQQGAVSLYARGRDYHKVLRSRLQRLADRIAADVGPLGHRVFTDSAPVLEAELAVRSGLGWRGRHTLVLDRDGGSMFFLGEIYLDIALPATASVESHCGSCRACMDACPTAAIVSEGLLDARRCISYLTIEHAGPIPHELRAAVGNRIYGCDDCQLVCPWNKFARPAVLADFDARPGLDAQPLVALLGWSGSHFLQRTEGSPIRRIGHARWLRNVALAAGNALRVADDAALRVALAAHSGHADAVVREQVAWSLAQAPSP